jgi:phage tail-like protein
MIFIIVLLAIIACILIFFFIIKPLFMSQNIVNRYHFTVEWGGSRINFTEVSGLDIEIEAIVFREGASPDDSFRKIPGLRKFSDITLKRGIVKGDNEFYAWLNTKQMDTIEKRDVRISLLDSNHQPVVVWKVHNAFPVKLSGPLLNAGEGDVAIETLVLTHDGLTIENN